MSTDVPPGPESDEFTLASGADLAGSPADEHDTSHMVSPSCPEVAAPCIALPGLAEDEALAADEAFVDLGGLAPALQSASPAHQDGYVYSMANTVYAPVELGTIRIGHLDYSRPEGPVPVRDDQFRITTLVRHRGEWIPHPIQEKLDMVNTKLREIPIRLQFDSPDLVMRSRLEAFDVRSCRSVCASAGSGKAKRMTSAGVQEVHCAGPAACAFANQDGIRCKLMGRLNVQIEGQEEVDNGFVLRTTSINTQRNLEARLARFWALFGGRLRGVPFKIVLRARTTAGSRWSRFYFVDIELNGVTLAEAKKLADKEAQRMQESGLDYAAWEAVIRAGLTNGALVFDDSEHALMQEFYTGGSPGVSDAGPLGGLASEGHPESGQDDLSAHNAAGPGRRPVTFESSGGAVLIEGLRRPAAGFAQSRRR